MEMLYLLQNHIKLYYLQMTFDLRNRSLVQSTNELITLVNRVNFLQREKDKIESYNLRTLQKTNQIHQIKENYRSQVVSPAHGQSQDRIRAGSSNHLRKSQLNQTKLAISRMKYDKVEEFRQRKEQEKVILDEARQDLFRKKQEQYDLVRRSKKQSKQHVQDYWSKKIGDVQHQKFNERFIQNQRCQLQDQSIEKLEQLESNLIQNLKQSQELTRVLDKQLDDVLHLRHEEFKKIYPRESQQKGKRNYSHVRSRVIQTQLYNKTDDIKLPIIESQKNMSSRICGVDITQEYRNRIMKIYSNHKDLALFYKGGRVKGQCLTERNSRHQSSQKIKIDNTQFRDTNQFNKRQLISDVTQNSKFYTNFQNLNSFDNQSEYAQQKLSLNQTTEKSRQNFNQNQGLSQDLESNGELINIQNTEQEVNRIEQKEIHDDDKNYIQKQEPDLQVSGFEENLQDEMKPQKESPINQDIEQAVQQQVIEEHKENETEFIQDKDIYEQQQPLEPDNGQESKLPNSNDEEILPKKSEEIGGQNQQTNQFQDQFEKTEQ